MARILTPTYADDLSHVESIAYKTVPGDDEGAPVQASPGATLPASQRCSIVLTQGEKVYLVDTSQGNPLAALLRSAGVTQSKRGAKAKTA